MSETKNKQISATIFETRQRRESLDCKVFKIKLVDISDAKSEKLSRFFAEAKWIYNSVLGSEDPLVFDYKSKEVPVHVFNKETGKCDIIEQRQLTLGSQMKQHIFKEVSLNAYALHKARQSGNKIGKLKFKSEVNRIHLKQHGTTFRMKENKVTIQKLGSFRSRGLKQIPEGAEIACADLVRKPSGFYLHVVTYNKPEKRERSGEIGIDFGIKDAVILSNGEKFKWSLNVPADIKRGQQSLSRKKRGSNNHFKQRQRLLRKHERLMNKKEDAANKFVSSLKNYAKVVIQDDDFSQWQAGHFGKRVSTSILGRIKAKIKNLPTSEVIDRYLPTTSECPCCHTRVEMPTSKREFHCPSCGHREDRDIKAAKMILDFSKTPAERGCQPAETSDKIMSVKQEAPLL
jgi:transposase